MITTLVTALLGAVLAMLLMFRSVANASDGYEDGAGFHFGKSNGVPPNQIRRRWKRKVKKTT